MQAAAAHRLLLLRMEPEAAIEVAKLGGALAGGAFGVEILKRWFGWRKRRQREPVEFQARILDEGDKLRELLLEEMKRKEEAARVATERAHQSELKLAVLQADHSRLQIRLERKDEQVKLLIAQIVKLGEVPITMENPRG